ncbi:MAG TPA: phosphotransferase [Roseiflexaceae bacterium]|nr:phosphotransferase [Roseiflexaceae bacterium]
MMLNEAQLAVIVAQALPGERLAGMVKLTDDRCRLILAGGSHAIVQLFAAPAAAQTAVAALRLLRGEFDLPVPVLRGSDTDGVVVGQPYLLAGDLPGVPLAQVYGQIGDEQLYRIGRQLGAAAYRIHRLACGRFGALAGADALAADDARSYGMARLVQALVQAAAAGVVYVPTAAQMPSWFRGVYQPIGRQAALICGGFTPATIMVQQHEGHWRLSGLLGWEHAIGWDPAWEHVRLLDALGGANAFGLRVGYGNGYDELNQRTYEQVREPVMRPYRFLLKLEALAAVREPVAIRRLRAVLNALME